MILLNTKTQRDVLLGNIPKSVYYQLFIFNVKKVNKFVV